MENQEDEIERVYWTSEEVAKMIGIKVGALHSWNKEFNVGAVRGIYSKKMIAKMHHIHNLLKVELFTIRGAKLKVKLTNHY